MSRPLNYLSGVFAVGLLTLTAACAAMHSGQSGAATGPSPTIAPALQPAAAQTAESQVPRITVEELKKLLADGQAVVVDVRPAEAYNGGHIKGSINLPLDKIKAGEYKNLSHDKRIVTYCSCGTEQSSAAASILLEKAGFKNTAALLGGTHAWQQSGGAMEVPAPKAKS